MQPYAYKGKLHSFLKNFALHKNFGVAQDLKPSPPPSLGSRYSN